MKTTAQLMMLFCLSIIGKISLAQTGSITGTIFTSDKKPAVAVNIGIKGSTNIQATKEDGSFFFDKIKDGQYTLIVSFSGLQTQEKAVQVNGSKMVQVNFLLQENADELDNVTIKATRSLNRKAISIGKSPIELMDLPQSVTIVGQGVIKEQQSLRLSDVIKNVNGVYLGTTRANTQETFFARGYSLGANNMFKNGARLNTGSMPEVSGLEQVEMLKGSAAILYGNVAPGGIINMVSKQPKFRFGGEVAMRTGSFGLYKPTVDIYGPISSKIAYRVNGTYETSNSFRDVVNSTRYYVNPSMLFKVGKRTEILVQADYLYHKFTPDFGLGSLADTVLSPLSRNTFLGTPWQYCTTQQTTATVGVKHQFTDNWQLNASASYQNYSRDYYSTERIQAKANGDWARPLGRSNSVEDYYTAQLNINGKFKTGKLEHILLAGVDADEYFTEAIAYNNPAIYDTINILNPNKFVRRTDIPAATAIRVTKTPIVRAGAYVQDLISITSKIKLLAGVRYSFQETQAVTTVNLLNSAETKGKIKTDKAFSPRFGLVYRPTNTTTFFASYANSFVVNNATDTTIKGQTLDPSIVDQFEIGVKNDFFKGLLSANLTIYRIVNNNLAQTAQFTATGALNTITNLKEMTGQTTSDGIEIDLSSHPVRGLSVMAGYSYNYMRYSKTPNTKGSFLEGERLVSTPAHTANTSIFYTFTGNNKLKGFKIGASAYYVGERVAGWNNTKDQAQQYDRRINVAGFTTLDFTIGYSYKAISLLAKMSNVTNTYSYYVHENYSVNPIAPRQFAATLSYKF
jgi:iron complex outermembrane recepter protein